MTDLCRHCDQPIDASATLHWDGESAAHVECYVASLKTQPARQDDDDEGLYGFESATPVEPDDEDPRVLAHSILSLAKRTGDPTLVVMAEELLLACEDGDYETAEFIDGQIKERARDISTVLRGLQP